MTSAAATSDAAANFWNRTPKLRTSTSTSSSLREAANRAAQGIKDLFHVDLDVNNYDEPGLVALLLPAAVADKAHSTLEGHADICITAVADTTYLNFPRRLWILKYTPKTREESPAAALSKFTNFIGSTFSNSEFRIPEDGPFIWPVHDKDLTRAITVSAFKERRDVPTWRKVLWGLRIHPLPNGTMLADNVTRHYGHEVGYVFAWSNLFVRSLWTFTAICIFFVVIRAQPRQFGINSLAFYIFLFATHAWNVGVAAISRGRRYVLQFQALGVKCDEDGGVVPMPKPIGRSGMALSQAAVEAAGGDVVEPTEPVNERRSKVKRALLKARFCAHLAFVKNVVRDNPDYVPTKKYWLWQGFAFTVSLVIASAFLCTSLLCVVMVLHLKAFLIFDWGDCFKRYNCDSSSLKYGLPGTLAEICADITLGIGIALLGEASKGVSFHLAKLWNFKHQRKRLYVQAMLSLIIEVVAKVGLFGLMAFYFLPEWQPDTLYRKDLNAMDTCGQWPDFQICSLLSDCNHQENPMCCAFSLSCASAILPFKARRRLFDTWLFGAFVVAPFIDVLVQIMLGGFAKRLYKCVDRRGGCCCAPLARLLSIIFVLEGEVTGLRYVCRGKTFGPVSKVTAEDKAMEECLEEALGQAVLREFDAIDELKDLKLVFLFVTMFAPVMPLGVLPTLAARIIENHLKLPKLFKIRRRSFPRDSTLSHQTQETFMILATVACVFWHFGLAFLSYNHRLHTWRLGYLGIWLVSSCVTSAGLLVTVYKFGNWFGKATMAAVRLTEVVGDAAVSVTASAVSMATPSSASNSTAYSNVVETDESQTSQTSSPTRISL
eukprot:TRINITY_DN15243_c0_g1_i4.p1 TRINITY_DN15243_c0_g1~~TRINITY_DN15243_c0_g1_i4.p1  ORF type:complete len:838 (+),score=113.72 TRINITY_DN15243_c0_g1_i4:26-2515(+)